MPRLSRDPRLPITEAQWQTVVLRYARTFGWCSYHTKVSFGSKGGFPDLVLVRRPRLIFAELKSEKGKPSPEQIAWLKELGGCSVEAYLWRPGDVREVVECLSRKPPGVPDEEEFGV